MEFWKDIKEDPRYEVSNEGRVRNKATGRILIPQLNHEGGYHRVTIQGKHKYVHRLVADAFYDVALDKYKDVNHIDGNKTNNTVGNLEVVSRKENIRHAFINGLKYPMVVKVVRCKFCKNRYDFDICADKPDDFYCTYGERR